MPLELFPEMARSVFRPLVQQLEKERLAAEISPTEIRELIYACGAGAALLDQMVAILHGILRQGLEKSKLQFMQKEFLDIVESAVCRTYPRVRAMIGTSQFAPEERTALLATVDDFVNRAAAIGAGLQTLQSVLDRPRPTVDFAQLNGRSGPIDYESYEDSKQIEKRLKAGGDF